MADIRNSTAAIPIDTRFDGFLFAVIGQSKSGMAITVMSALARLNFDPWTKAAELSALSNVAAAHKLKSLVVGLPDFIPTDSESSAIDRLVILLPDCGTVHKRAEAASFGILTNARMLIVYVTLLAVMFGAEHLWDSTKSQNQAAGLSATVPGAVPSAASQVKSDH
jgi:hypothetical protein